MEKENSLMAKYFQRLEERLSLQEELSKKFIRIQSVVRSADRHLVRLDLPIKRYLRAIRLEDELSISYEADTVLALLYEIADTSFMTLQMLDFDEFGLTSAEDGQGLTGEAAITVVSLLKTLDQQCWRLMQIEREYKLRLDFSRPVDEREGITFNHTRHWQDFFSESIEKSFYLYFAEAQLLVHQRLHQIPNFWEEQTIGQYLELKGYSSLLTILRRLESATLPYDEELKDQQPSSFLSWAGSLIRGQQRQGRLHKLKRKKMRRSSGSEALSKTKTEPRNKP